MNEEMSEEGVICPLCSSFVSVEAFSNHYTTQHQKTEEEARATVEKSERYIKQIVKKPDEEIVTSSKILSQILEKLKVSASTIDEIINEIKDLEENKNPEMGEFVSPAEVYHVLQTFGIRQPKLSYITQKYSNKIYQKTYDAQQRFYFPPSPPAPSFSLPLFYPEFPHSAQYLPQYSALGLQFKPMLLQQPPLPQQPPPKSHSEEEEREVVSRVFKKDEEELMPYQDSQGNVQYMKKSQIAFLEEFRTMKENLAMRKEKHDLEILKLQKEITSSSSTEVHDNKITVLEDKIKTIEDELHKKDIELLKKEYELKMEQLKQPSFVDSLRTFYTHAELLGLKKTGRTGMDLLDDLTNMIDLKLDKVLALAAESSTGEQREQRAVQKLKTPKTREKITQSLEAGLEKAKRLDELKSQFLEVWDLPS